MCKIDNLGTKRWYNNGLLHRTGDKPAVVYLNGTKQWWVNGLKHRDGGLPAVVYLNGTKQWWVNGKLHRDGDQHACIWSNGTKEWWVNGNRHRDGGLPAVERPDGFNRWYFEGYQITEEQSKRIVARQARAKRRAGYLLFDRFVAPRIYDMSHPWGQRRCQESYQEYLKLVNT